MRRAGGARKNVPSAGASEPPSLREVPPPSALEDAAATPWAHRVPGSGANIRQTPWPREPRPRETQRRRTPSQQQPFVSYLATQSEETDLIRVAVGGSEWTASHSSTRERRLRMKPLGEGQKGRGRGVGRRRGEERSQSRVRCIKDRRRQT